MLTPDNRVIMITGANRGIGLATAQALAAAGYRLSLGVRDMATLEAAKIGADVMVCQWDATNPQDSARWVAKTTERFGQIDGVVLNAGILQQVSVEDDNDAAYDAMWQTNFLGPMRLIRSAMPHLRQSGHGRVVNLVSLTGKRVMTGKLLGYAASKFAANALTHAIRHDGWTDNVRATSLCPGLVETDMIRGFEVPDGQFTIEPETVAASVAYILSLPNRAVLAELLLNSRLEPML